MPANTTHMYVASRLADSFGSVNPHNSDVLADINKGFSQWLEANRQFRKGAEDALARDSGKEMQKTMDAYRAALTTDEVAIFSAFTAGSQGPDLWMVPHQTALGTIFAGGIVGATQFDLGHYNLTHAFPLYTLRVIKGAAKTMPLLQRKYQTAYILGYLTHIALDITGHIKVNVFAGAYFQMAKDWENEQGIITRNLFNNHNKIEQYADSLVRFICFEGCHSSLSHLDNVRKNGFEQPDAWDFPNYTDYWSNRLHFGANKTNGIFDRDETFLDMSTSLPGPFAARYADGNPQRRVQPFIWRYFLNAYYLCDSSITTNGFSITNLESERVKLDFYRMDNNRDVHSQYYLMNTVCPNLDKIKKWGVDFYDPKAFGQFTVAGRLVGNFFVQQAIDYLQNNKGDIFYSLRNWNLDIGMAIRLKDISAVTDSADPKKPPRPILIDLVNVYEAIADLQKWKPPQLSVSTWRKNQADAHWTKPDRIAPATEYPAQMDAPSGTLDGRVLFAQSGIDLRLAGFKLFSDGDEHGGLIWGKPGEPHSNTVIGDEGYKIDTLLEDFIDEYSLAHKKQEPVGSATICSYTGSFLGVIPEEKAVEDPAKKKVCEFRYRPLPRFLRISTCRKYVCQTNDTGTGADSGNFHPSKFTVRQEASPSEEFCFTLFALIKNTADYSDVFSDSLFTQAQIDELKHIKQIGVNTLLLLFTRDTTKPLTRLKILEAYIDGELQYIEKVSGNPPPPSSVYKVEFEDTHFRTDSAVMMPDALSYKKDPAKPESPDLNGVEGLAILQVIYIQAKENPNQKLIIAGHTDRVGNPNFNFPLSGDRATSILCLLEGRKNDWFTLVDKRHHKEDIYQILRWASVQYGWDCDPGSIENPTWTQSNKALKNFQKSYNDTFITPGRVDEAYGTTAKKIDEDGALGPQTWGAVFDVYQDQLALKLETTFEQMPAKFHGSLNNRWVEDANKAVPCGETFPREKPEEDEYESAVNRRVEALFFDPNEIPASPLPCNSSEKIKTAAQAGSRTANCTDKCPVYKNNKTPLPIKVTPHAWAQTAPLLLITEAPDIANRIALDGLVVYLAYYKDGSDTLASVRTLFAKKGTLHSSRDADTPVTIDADRETWVYVSNRADLDTIDVTERARRFAKDRSGLPLGGPMTFACGEAVETLIDVWKQNDWVVVKGVPVDSKAPDSVWMGDWRTNYSIGWHGTTKKDNKPCFIMYGDYTKKQDSQESWNYSGMPIKLSHIINTAGEKRWLGTLSLIKAPSAKVFLAADVNDKDNLGTKKYIFGSSFNDIKAESVNHDLPGFHTYNKNLAGHLLGLNVKPSDAAAIDALPAPPEQFTLPGDICWHTQGNTNFCGAYSFAAAMNYWYPYTNNAFRESKNGAWYADTSRIPARLVPSGARTPDDIMDGAAKFNMQTRKNTAKQLDKEHALTLLKLWLSAGIPVMVLVNEKYGVMSMHWKVVIGYDKTRIEFINSGADNEFDVSKRSAGIDYDTAPVGNDIDSIDAFYAKWSTAGLWLINNILATSVDECMIMPIYPKDPQFEGDKPR
jgi:hypothetical protein